MHISKIDRSGQTRPIIKEPNDDVKKKHTKNDFKFAKKNEYVPSKKVCVRYN